MVVPDVTPVTVPPELMVATVVALLLHVPLPPSVSTVVEFTHTEVAPEMVAGAELIVIRLVSRHPVLNE